MHLAISTPRVWGLRASPSILPPPPSYALRTSITRPAHRRSVLAQAEPGPEFRGPSRSRYDQANSMAELYLDASSRPPAIPISEHVARRKKKDIQEICDAAKRKGKAEAEVREKLEALEGLIPEAINLHKLRPSDYVTIIEDVPAVANKLVVLKTLYPQADVFKVINKLPKLMLRKDSDIREDAEKVKAMLSSASSPDFIIEATPEFTDPRVLERALVTISGHFKGKNPVEVLEKEPDILSHMGGESGIEDSAEYGELSTKD